jgi:alpha-1,6-mannosyltransferase
MHLVDVTMFYCPRSGGVKRYLLSKHAWLSRHASSIRHSILAPAPQRASQTVRDCGGWSIDLIDGYRLPLDVSRWHDTLLEMRPDLIEAADPYVPGWAARLAAARLGIPAIAFYHSDMPRLLAGRVGSWVGPIARRYLRRFYEGFDLVLAPSGVMMEHLAQAGVEHVALQPLGVDVHAFNPDAADRRLRQQLNLPAHARLIVYAGRFAKEKNIDVLAAAVRELGAPYHLLLIGGRRRERMHQQITVLPYQRDTERLARLLASCDVFVHAGDHETYGLVAAEAMACGLPVVGVAQGALREIVDDAVGAVAERADHRLLAQAIDFTFARDLTALRNAARTRAVMRFGWDHVFKTMLSRYASLLSRHASPPRAVAAVRM